MLAKTQRVLHRQAVTSLGQVFHHDDDAWTWQRVEVVLPSDLWVELGSPEALTVTVEPGDLLND
jgi:hypothetical protein